MINLMIFNLFAVLALILPANVASFSWFETNTAEGAKEENHQNTQRLKETIHQVAHLIAEDDEETKEDKPVTTMEVARAADTTSAEEDPEPTLADWKDTFPVYEESSYQVEFIQAIAPAAVLIVNEQGVYPSVMIAQAALESSWGQSDLAQSYNNLMGTKGNTEGKSVTVRTREDQNGQSVYIDAGFTIYDSWADSLYHYGSLMKNGLSWDPEFYSGTWRENTESYQDATAWLQGRYASDTSYAPKLNQTIESFNLTQYDEMETPEHELEEALEEVSADL